MKKLQAYIYITLLLNAKISNLRVDTTTYFVVIYLSAMAAAAVLLICIRNMEPES